MNLSHKYYQAKKQLSNMQQVLDDLYQDVLAVRKAQKEPIIPADIVQRISDRMVYLNKVKNKPLMEVNARLEELARLLDWMER